MKFCPLGVDLGHQWPWGGWTIMPPPQDHQAPRSSFQIDLSRVKGDTFGMGFQISTAQRVEGEMQKRRHPPFAGPLLPAGSNDSPWLRGMTRLVELWLLEWRRKPVIGKLYYSVCPGRLNPWFNANLSNAPCCCVRILADHHLPRPLASLWEQDLPQTRYIYKGVLLAMLSLCIKHRQAKKALFFPKCQLFFYKGSPQVPYPHMYSFLLAIADMSNVEPLLWRSRKSMPPYCGHDPKGVAWGRPSIPSIPLGCTLSSDLPSGSLHPTPPLPL